MSRKDRPRGRHPGIKRLLWGIAALLVLLAGWLTVLRSQEEAALARAAQQFRNGRLEAALATLGPLSRRPLLSSATRRAGAELYFRLGQDEKAHALLRGQRYEEAQAEDRQLRDLSSRNLRAADLLKRADASQDPEERVRLVRQAQLQLPDAPHVLQRLVQEELLAMTRSRNPEYEQAFVEDYQALKLKAPGLAAEVKRGAEELLRRQAD